ncbi:MAG: hypothetical protein CMF61_04395 [Magnetococcales bacterium]|nr:hypothetical protein [Magnetococcales bacterium]PPR19427.1 MAG: hypothetical protein CFH43_00187 [Pseudomonadota bacterium]
MKKFFQCTKRQLYWVAFLWVAMVFGLYAYNANISTAMVTRYAQYDDVKMSWNHLNTRNYQQKMPEQFAVLVNDIQHLSQGDQFKALMKQTFQFNLVNGGETDTKTPYELLQTGVGDCSDFAYLWYHQLWRLGVPAQYITLMINHQGETFMHSVAVARDEMGQLVVFDTLTFLPLVVPYKKWKEMYDMKLLFAQYGQTTETLYSDVTFFNL